MLNEFYVQGNETQVKRFFELARVFQDAAPLQTPLVIASWPLGGNQKLGLCIKANDALPHQMEKAVAASGVKLLPITELENRLANELSKLRIQFWNACVFIDGLVQQNAKGNLTCTGMDWNKAREFANRTHPQNKEYYE